MLTALTIPIQHIRQRVPLMETRLFSSVCEASGWVWCFNVINIWLIVSACAHMEGGHQRTHRPLAFTIWETVGEQWSSQSVLRVLEWRWGRNWGFEIDQRCDPLCLFNWNFHQSCESNQKTAQRKGRRGRRRGRLWIFIPSVHTLRVPVNWVHPKHNWQEGGTQSKTELRLLSSKIGKMGVVWAAHAT